MTQIFNLIILFKYFAFVKEFDVMHLLNNSVFFLVGVV